MAKIDLEEYITLYGDPIYSCKQKRKKGETFLERFHNREVPELCYIFKIDHPTKVMIVSGNKDNDLHANWGERTVINQLLEENARLKANQLPKTITAENGCKGLLIGEFSESLEVSCPECNNNEDPCSFCEDNGTIPQKVPVSWTTIKDIYKAIVSHFEKNPELVDK